MTDLAGASEKANLDSLDNEIKELEKALHNYEQRWSSLLEAMELGEFEKDEILNRLNNIKRLRRLENLQHSTPEIKVLALDALVIKVYARGTDDVEIQGVIPLELPTTGQTSHHCSVVGIPISMEKAMHYQGHSHVFGKVN